MSSLMFLLLAFVAAGTAAVNVRQAPGADGLLFVAGGVFGDGDEEELFGDVEVLDMSASDPVLPCFKPAVMPEPLHGHTAAYFGGAPTMCGGELTGVDPPVAQKYCFQYAYGLGGLIDQWDVAEDRLEVARVNSASTMLADGEWWITGGENGADTTEKMLELLSDGSDAAPDLPEPKDGHNVVPVDEDTAFITNGATDSSFLYGRSDPEDDGTFTQVEDQGEERYQGFAGLIRKADGTREILVTGGLDMTATTRIFSLDGDQTWRDGPPLPFEELSAGASVQLETTFLVVGGLGRETEDDPVTYAVGSVLWFDPDEEEWAFAPQALTNPRWDFAAVMVPQGFVECF